VRSDAGSPQDYVASLPEDRREAIAAVRAAILAGLPGGYEEGMQFGMLSWHVPLSPVASRRCRRPGAVEVRPA